MVPPKHLPVLHCRLFCSGLFDSVTVPFSNRLRRETVLLGGGWSYAPDLRSESNRTANRVVYKNYDTISLKKTTLPHQFMKKVILIFPAIAALSDFVQDYMISGLEVNTSNLSVTGELTEHQVADACNNYQARLRTTIPFPEEFRITGYADNWAGKNPSPDDHFPNLPTGYDQT